MATAALTWISAGERYRILETVTFWKATVDLYLSADSSCSRYVDVSITVERCVDNVDFTVVSRWVLSRYLYACWLSTRVNLPVARRGCDVV
ncbi:putative LRR receptor-like serine/threonine-protein kinase [Dorcoceras hygrometricum]|uniref:Putative LRR receptor-like serine/threonine-protein kinase n=1 Tax=Dorcoceras hygrometricum TaxID=472368 RepID=A0A2Z7A328_9LAMI|nr:putative LRR receptor-like serine/threonine-protein kinase [Dorcoceras hygrometricum]